MVRWISSRISSRIPLTVLYTAVSQTLLPTGASNEINLKFQNIWEEEEENIQVEKDGLMGGWVDGWIDAQTEDMSEKMGRRQHLLQWEKAN